MVTQRERGASSRSGAIMCTQARPTRLTARSTGFESSIRFLVARNGAGGTGSLRSVFRPNMVGTLYSLYSFFFICRRSGVVVSNKKTRDCLAIAGCRKIVVIVYNLHPRCQSQRTAAAQMDVRPWLAAPELDGCKRVFISYLLMRTSVAGYCQEISFPFGKLLCYVSPRTMQSERIATR